MLGTCADGREHNVKRTGRSLQSHGQQLQVVTPHGQKSYSVFSGFDCDKGFLEPPSLPLFPSVPIFPPSLLSLRWSRLLAKAGSVSLRSGSLPLLLTQGFAPR